MSASSAVLRNFDLNLLPMPEKAGVKRWAEEEEVLMIDYKLIYRSGTATAVLINGFHTPQGDKNARISFNLYRNRQQVRGIPQVLWDQLLLELLPVVLHRWQRLRLPPVSHLRAKNLK
ncbi:hypothetical protein VPH35_036781 [Triticum aestivum]|uniref:Uncharacterized protein n=1 Tax=Aegilops tauschii TaxID=37682 RepID=M8D9F4_AEGTA